MVNRDVQQAYEQGRPHPLRGAHLGERSVVHTHGDSQPFEYIYCRWVLHQHVARHHAFMYLCHIFSLLAPCVSPLLSTCSLRFCSHFTRCFVRFLPVRFQKFLQSLRTLLPFPLEAECHAARSAHDAAPRLPDEFSIHEGRFDLVVE